LGFNLDKVIDIFRQNSDFFNGFFTEGFIHENRVIEMSWHNFLSFIVGEVSLNEERGRGDFDGFNLEFKRNQIFRIFHFQIRSFLVYGVFSDSFDVVDSDFWDNERKI
jgi:hypothetical protein